MLILFSQFLVQGLGLTKDDVKDAVLALEAFCLGNLFFCSVLKEHGTVCLLHADIGHLNPSTGKAKQVALPNPEGHRREPGRCSVVFSKFLVEADIAFLIVVREDRAYTA